MYKENYRLYQSKGFINLNLILHDNHIHNSLSDFSKDCIIITGMLSYGTGINVCSCENSNFMNQNLGHILTGGPQIIENHKLNENHK